MAYNLRKRTKVNLTPTSNSTKPKNTNSNNNNNDDEIAPVIVIIKGENQSTESNNNKKKGKRKMEHINKREGDSDNIQNIEQTQQQQTNVVQAQAPPQQQAFDSFSGDIIVHQLLQATNLFFQLDLQSILSLALTSKTLFKPLSSLISQHFTFHLKHTPLIHYHPKKLRIQTFDIDGLFDNPCLSNVTEIEFKKNEVTYPPSFTNYPFDKAITNLLSLNLTHFTIGSYFNQPINSLIHLTKLTHLEFSYKSVFNHPIDSFLPPNLTSLYCGFFFDHPVENLPESLTKLVLGYCFKQPLDKLPPNITHLDVPRYTPSQYEHIQKMPSILYFNGERMKPNLDQRRNNSVSESVTQINT